MTKTAETKAAKTAPRATVASRLHREGTGTDAQFYRVRANGTKRHVPTLSGDALALAKAIKAERSGDSPKTMRAIADERHMSVSSVRRLLTSLELTEEVAKKATARKPRATKATAKPEAVAQAS